jgi:DNA-binding CsgD family transcriptional regulator
MVATLPPVGREAELSALGRFFGTDGSARLLLLVGEPGIGKTALWEAGIAIAQERGLQCLRTRTSEAETQLSFAGLADLLDGVARETLVALPAPQLRALEVATRRADPAGAPPDPLAISTGFLTVLRFIATSGPLLIAVDDMQWLDPPSAAALAFAARRLAGQPVRFLLSRRNGPALELERAFESGGVKRLDIQGMSMGAISRLLSERLEVTLPRRALRRVFETAHGNPLFVLELGRTLLEQGVPDIGAEFPLPDVIEEVFGARVSALAAPLRRVLLAVGLSAGLGRPGLGAVADPLALEDALAAGLLVEECGSIRASHPLLAVTAVRKSNAKERREVHLAIAGAVPDEPLRARHLALATAIPDVDLAATVAAAAALAAERGAAHEAVELAQHALRLTPADATEYSARLLELAHYLATAGEFSRVIELLVPRIEMLPAGEARAAAHLLLAEGVEDTEGGAEHLERAIAESAGARRVRARALARKAMMLAVLLVEQIAVAEALASEAVSLARSAGAEVECGAAVALAWTRLLAGRRIGHLAKRLETTPVRVSLYQGSIDRPIAARMAMRGELAAARAVLDRLSTLADERGEARSVASFHIQRCELELRAGDAVRAVELLDDWDQMIEPDQTPGPMRPRLQALLAALQGHADRAEQAASSVLDMAEAARGWWDRLEALRALGIAALFKGDPEGAVARLAGVWAHTVREGVDEPGAFPVAVDLVEALVACGRIEDARSVAQRLERLAVSQRHPWGLASAKRCGAMIELADEYADDTAQALAEAAVGYERLGLGFDSARSRLFLGRVQRRFKKRGEARRSLEQAQSMFAQLGCEGWASTARSELARVSGRRPADEGELTPSEHRVVELAASGLSNKEIAAQLVVSVYTVEGHLKHAYRKLGVRSRNQLAAALQGLG